ncbi:MAG TPA: cytochrome c [Anaerolineae bacterium]
MRRKQLYLFTLICVLALLLVGCGGTAAPAEPPASPTPSGDPVAGETLFVQSCSACHGPEGEGIEGLGKDMTTSSFIAGMDEQEFLTFVKTGRPIGHPDNTTGVDMPPKGGNPALTDEQLLDIIAYIRTFQQ